MLPHAAASTLPLLPPEQASSRHGMAAQAARYWWLQRIQTFKVVRAHPRARMTGLIPKSLQPFEQVIGEINTGRNTVLVAALPI
jgi:hypothetical protein